MEKIKKLFLVLNIILSCCINITYTMEQSTSKSQYNFNTSTNNASSTSSQSPSSSTTINYSINLIWINKILNQDQRYLYSSKNKQNLTTENDGKQAVDTTNNYLIPIFKWARTNTNATINVWFDSELNTTDAARNTISLFASLFHNQNINLTKIKFRDIRTIPLVQKNPDIFSDKIPVYFRIDLLRAVIALYLLFYTKENDYFVYGDLDMKPMSEEELFDNETLESLETDGIVMAESDDYDFENGFQIISNKNAHIFEAINWAIITLNIQRVYALLLDQHLNQNQLKNIAECVYDSYGNMFKYLNALNGLAKLEIHEYTNFNPSNTQTCLSKRIYNKKADGLEPFYNLKFEINCVSYNNKIFPYIPTKKVELPPREGDYYSEEEDDDDDDFSIDKNPTNNSQSVSSSNH